jgi:hypothetical protein
MTSIESTFGMSDSERLLLRLRTLHRDRVEAIKADKAIVPLSDPSRLVIHLIPEEAVSGTKDYSAAEVKRAAQGIRPLGARNGGYGECRFNADGVLLYSGREVVRCYSQLYRSGIYEGVMAEAVVQPKEQAKTLRENWCEDAMLGALVGYLSFAKTLGLQPPFWMFAAMVGCEGARICLNRSWGDFSQDAIDRSLVWLPQQRVDSFDVDGDKLLRPVFDVLWNSVGLEGSPSYDEQGNKTERRQIP